MNKFLLMIWMEIAASAWVSWVTLFSRLTPLVRAIISIWLFKSDLYNLGFLDLQSIISYLDLALVDCSYF